MAMTVEQLWQRVPGGSGSYITELARALSARADVRVTGIAARHPSGDRRALAVPVRRSRLPRPALYAGWARARWPRAERIGGPADVVHATTWAVPGTRLPLVVTVHDLAFLDEPEHFTPRGNAFFRRALATVRDEAARVVVPSGATADACAAHGIERGRTVVIPHGVRTDPAAGSRAAAFRDRVGARRPYVLWCGTLEPRKNVEGLLTAFAAAVDAGADLDLVLVGPAGWGDTPGQALRAARSVGEDRVHLTGRISDAELQAAYAGARVFAYPSLREGFGMPVLEAMAHGVPVVTSLGTPMAEVVQDGGLLVDPRDTDALAAAVVAASGAEHARLAAGAHRDAAGRTWEASAAAHADVYHQARAVG